MKIRSKVCLSVLVLLISCVMVGYTFIYQNLSKSYIDDSKMKKQLDEAIINKEKIKGENKESKKDKDKKIDDEVTNILLFGVDNRVGRADAIMILTLDEKHKKIKLTSIMRDTYVNIPGLGHSKLNHAYAFGYLVGESTEKMGPLLLMKTIEENFNIKIDKYIEVNFDGFKDVIDTVGGINVNIKGREMLNELNRCLLLEKYEDRRFKNQKFKNIVSRGDLLWARDEGAKYLIKNNPRITEEEYNYIADKADFIYRTGDITLDGTQILAYTRMRHSTGGSQSRTGRHREIIQKILNKFKDKPVGDYPSIVNSFLPYVKYNIDVNEIMLSLTKKVANINNFHIEQLRIPVDKLSQNILLGKDYYFDKDSPYRFFFVYDKEKTLKVMHDFVFDDIEYNPDEFEQFKASNAGYKWYVFPKKKEIEKVENNKENIEDSQENSDNKTDKKNNNKDNTKELNENNTIQDIENSEEIEINNNDDNELNIIEKNSSENELDADENEQNEDTETKILEEQNRPNTNENNSQNNNNTDNENLQTSTEDDEILQFLNQ